MANNQNHQLNTDQIRELLSPYLDGEVTDAERIQVEQALAASPELQRELDTLRRTVAMVAALPVVAAPRPFTLTEAQVKPAKPARTGFLGLPGWFKGVAALAATLLCVVAAGGLFWSMQFGSSQPAAEIASAPTAPMEAPAAAPVQQEADEAQSAAREEVPETAAKATEEVRVEADQAPLPEPTAGPAADTMMAVPAEPPTTAQEAVPAEEPMALESQAYEAAPTEQSAAAAAVAVTATPTLPTALMQPELTAAPSPESGMAAMAVPTQEEPQEKAAANGEAEAGQMAAESAPASTEAPIQESAEESASAPTEAPVEESVAAGAAEAPAQENADASAAAQTDQLTAESAPAAEPEQVEQAQATPTATPSPQPSGTPIAVLTLPVPETPQVTPMPTPLIESRPTDWGLTIVVAVAGLLVIVGLIIWLISRGQNRTPS